MTTEEQDPAERILEHEGENFGGTQSSPQS